MFAWASEGDIGEESDLLVTHVELDDALTDDAAVADCVADDLFSCKELVACCCCCCCCRG